MQCRVLLLNLKIDEAGKNSVDAKRRTPHVNVIHTGEGAFPSATTLPYTEAECNHGATEDQTVPILTERLTM
jgi:hypothetical protein